MCMVLPAACWSSIPTPAQSSSSSSTLQTPCGLIGTCLAGAPLTGMAADRQPGLEQARPSDAALLQVGCV